MSSLPMSGGIERTSAVIIGTGLAGLAVASELQRRGVGSIVVEGLDLLGAGHPANTSSLQRCGATDAASMQERNEILRHLRNYASSHKLDVRNGVRAQQVDRLEAGTGGSRTQPWAVRTPGGVLVADHLVLTRCAYSQLRRMLSELGMVAGQNLKAAMHALGMYLVGVGQLITPSPKEALRQAKDVGRAISTKVHPDRGTVMRPTGHALAAPAWAPS